MNLIVNILVLLVIIGFVGVFLFSFILNLIRAINANKAIKTNPSYVEGKVIEITKDKRRVYVRVEYISKSNMTKFNDVFEFTPKEFNDQYYEGQEVKIYYADPKGLKKVNCFPIYLEGQKRGLEVSPIVLDAFLFAGSVYVLVLSLLSLLTKDPKTGIIGLEWNGRPLISNFSLNTVPEGTTGCFNILNLFIFAIFYIMLFSYLVERISGMSAVHKQYYLKICGIKGTAEVKTFKYGKSKNAQGYKEAQMKIEFFTNSGEKVECDLNSYLYSETEEQFIDILYDEKNPKNVCYMRK